MKASNVFLMLVLLTAPLSLRSQSVEPAPIEISFYGNQNFSNDELVEDFKRNAEDCWKKFDDRAYTYFAQKYTRSLMFSRGFWKAKIVDIRPALESGNQTVRITVEEGRRYRLGTIRIEGNKAVPKEDILELLGQHPGDIADGKALQDFTYEKLKDKYADIGYIQYNAEFEPEFIEPNGESADGVVNVLLTIDEGRQFKLRGVRIVGVDAEESSALLDAFPIKSGDVFVPGRLEKWVDMINKTGQFGFLDKDQHVRILTSLRDRRPDVDLVISLRRTEP